MKTALIIGDSGGIGRSVSEQLMRGGWTVVGLSRRAGDFDLKYPDTLDTVLSGLKVTFDLIIVATGQLASPGKTPEKTVVKIDAQHMQENFLVNATGPAIVLKHAARLVAKKEKGVVVVLSARVGSIGDNNLGGWVSYRASKAALNQIVKTAAIELARNRPNAVCVAVHPGTVETTFTQAFHGTRPMKTAAKAAEEFIDLADRLRPSDSGQFMDTLGNEIVW